MKIAGVKCTKGSKGPLIVNSPALKNSPPPNQATGSPKDDIVSVREVANCATQTSKQQSQAGVGGIRSLVLFNPM